MLGGGVGVGVGVKFYGGVVVKGWGERRMWFRDWVELVRSSFGRCPHIRIDVWGTRRWLEGAAVSLPVHAPSITSHERDCVGIFAISNRQFEAGAALATCGTEDPESLRESMLQRKSCIEIANGSKQNLQ